MQKRCMQWAELNGKQRLLVGGQGQPLHPEPDVRPGRPARQPRRVLPRPQPRRQGHQVDVRRARADLAGVPRPRRPARGDGRAGPRRRVPVPHARRRHGGVAATTTSPALVAAFRGFNRWLDEDWGFNYEERHLRRADDLARRRRRRGRGGRVRARARRPHRVREERARCSRRTSRGRRAIPATTRCGRGSTRRASPSASTPATPATAATSRTGRTPATSSRSARPPFQAVMGADRVPFETYAALICHGVFDRFPNLRVASVESGAAWVGQLFKGLREGVLAEPGRVRRKRPDRVVPRARLGGAVLRGRPGRS